MKKTQWIMTVLIAMLICPAAQFCDAESLLYLAEPKTHTDGKQEKEISVKGMLLKLSPGGNFRVCSRLF